MDELEDITLEALDPARVDLFEQLLGERAKADDVECPRGLDLIDALEALMFKFEQRKLNRDALNDLVNELTRVLRCYKTAASVDAQVVQVRCGCGEVWCGVVWCGVAWRGVARRGAAWRGVGWRGVARRGAARRGVAWGGVAWRGVVSRRQERRSPLDPLLTERGAPTQSAARSSASRRSADTPAASASRAMPVARSTHQRALWPLPASHCSTASTAPHASSSSR